MPLINLNMQFCLCDKLSQSWTHLTRYFPVYPMLRSTQIKQRAGNSQNSEILDCGKNCVWKSQLLAVQYVVSRCCENFSEQQHFHLSPDSDYPPLIVDKVCALPQGSSITDHNLFDRNHTRQDKQIQERERAAFCFLYGEKIYIENLHGIVILVQTDQIHEHVIL